MSVTFHNFLRFGYYCQNFVMRVPTFVFERFWPEEAVSSFAAHKMHTVHKYIIKVHLFDNTRICLSLILYDHALAKTIFWRWYIEDEVICSRFFWSLLDSV